MARKPRSPQKSKPNSTTREDVADNSASHDTLQRQLEKTPIAQPLLGMMGKSQRHAVVIDLNFNHFEGLPGAKLQVCRLLAEVLLKKADLPPEGASLDELLMALSASVNAFKTRLCSQYVFAELTPAKIKRLLTADDKMAEGLSEIKRPLAHDVEGSITSEKAPAEYRCRGIYKIWSDFEASPMLTRTVSTVKADAARNAFSTTGKGIVWAVIDSGVEASHQHFALHNNLVLPPPLKHADFTGTDTETPFLDVPSDDFGHGTHVAGVIAGEIDPEAESTHQEFKPLAVSRVRDKEGKELYESWEIDKISGIAPQCKLLSLKVLDERGRGNRRASNILAALAYVNQLNDFGRNIRIHGVNLSVGYEFEAEWFGCGQSPLCIEVDRLVKSGVVVVAAAGNTGYGAVSPSIRGPNMAGLPLTINDPGNASLAITVGSTHRYMPHQYGVSYFSSKGPTGDGRWKPDLVAPGENVLSCAAGSEQQKVNEGLLRQLPISAQTLSDAQICRYRESSGTSMAAPHVSGAIAAFLSIRQGFWGHPERVKEIFLSTATDLGRERYFQGHGLIDLMRAIQSV